jgi:hypothetical protein
MPELSDRDRAVLSFEQKWTVSGGAKEAAIRATFHVSAARYFQLVNSLIDRPEALQQDPVLVKRLLRQRDQRLRRRTASLP